MCAKNVVPASDESVWGWDAAFAACVTCGDQLEGMGEVAMRVALRKHITPSPLRPVRNSDSLDGLIMADSLPFVRTTLKPSPCQDRGQIFALMSTKILAAEPIDHMTRGNVLTTLLFRTLAPIAL